jgi:hypothetical protein
VSATDATTLSNNSNNDPAVHKHHVMTRVVVSFNAGGKASRGRAESPSRLHAIATQPVVSPVKRATTRTVPQHVVQEYHPADVSVAQAVTGEAGISCLQHLLVPRWHATRHYAAAYHLSRPCGAAGGAGEHAAASRRPTKPHQILAWVHGNTLYQIQRHLQPSVLTQLYLKIGEDW